MGASPQQRQAANRRTLDASAHMYSLVQTARANELEPYAHLRRLFAALPAAQTVEQIEALLPVNLVAS
jgi:transposase